ncbi:glycosyltransferase family 4 protein [Algoriphagus sp. AK58]|uniref:glycosyltransferase family 4 protein n=1 Tax=Algoriphagus sp. AK58 TaxID=1406877 RepID=UPI00164FF170|nr:glycosyltransferase family 4 protein [Algoriphagus sp. AK58]MBC6369201.1 glycosyltransferase WbuB [Algoriphagus sp. AK58]
MPDKKLLIIGEAFFPEDFIINDLVKEWSGNGYRVEVLTRNPSYPYGKVYKGYKNKLYQKTYFEDILVHRVLVIPGYQKSKVIKVLNYFSFVFFASLVAIFIGRKFDKVFIYQTGPLTVALPGVLLKIIFKKPLTIWTQDLWPDTVYAYGFKPNPILDYSLNTLVSFVYNSSDRIAVSCKGFKPRLFQFLNSTKEVFWIPNWPMIDKEAKNPKSLPGEINFTFAGNIGRVQNLDKVILGFNEAVKDFPGMWLNLVGDGSALEDLKKLVMSQNIPNVNFTGRRPLEEMPEYFGASDVLIISLVDAPIYEKMIPSKFQTYLQYSKPIFAVMKGEVPNLIREHGIGEFADSNDILEIANGFKRMAEKPKDDLVKMGESAKFLLENYFNRKKNIQKLTELAFF